MYMKYFIFNINIFFYVYVYPFRVLIYFNKSSLKISNK